jgi:hypothetical protein
VKDKQRKKEERGHTSKKTSIDRSILATDGKINNSWFEGFGGSTALRTHAGSLD